MVINYALLEKVFVLLLLITWLLINKIWLLHCVWLNQFEWFHCTRGWILVGQVHLVELICEDGLTKIWEMW